MNIIVLKFGGSSLSDNEKLKKVATKVTNLVDQGKKVVVILSAQGDTTDKLLEQAKELSKNPNKRDLDMLLSVGEQISVSKFAILLNEIGYKAISLTGAQAGIITDNNYTEARIDEVHPNRILKELETNDIVAICGFQGVTNYKDITTIGRDGSDTTAIAISAALEQKECYIYTDIDGVYDKDPHKYSDAKRIEKLSYEQMKEFCNNGAKVLHGRCVQIAEKYGIKIIVKSTFEEKNGSVIG